MAKLLSYNDKLLIIADYKTGQYSQRQLAKKHDVSVGTISGLTKGVDASNEHLTKRSKIDIISVKKRIHVSKITEHMKNKIIEDFEKGISQRALAIKNNVSLGSVNKIVSGNHKTAINRRGTRPDGSVYLIYFKNQNDIFLKIGVATDIGLRLNNLQTGNPFYLILLYSRYFKNAYTIERDMHNHFSEYNFNSEWFCVTESIMQEIKQKIESF